MKLSRRTALVVGILFSAASAGCASDAAVPAAPRLTPREARQAALAAASVWQPPTIPISQADLRHNPAGPGGFADQDDLTCRFTLRAVGGTTPKFYCETQGGEAVKIKYGSSNPELPAEVAASRLLSALGFWTDRMFVVRSVQCAGCPTFPFQALRCLEHTRLHSACFPRGIDYSAVVAFPAAVVERRIEGRVIESSEDQGWAWYELEQIDPSRGGSTRAEVDALRLMAVLLAHWDNKASNQRLVCPPGSDQPDGSCGRPVAVVQDLGATFGPTKLDLHNWRRGRIWKDAGACSVSMKHLPWGGATFPDTIISEDGRRLVLSLLEQLSNEQLRDLFEGSRVTSHDQFSADARATSSWVNAFNEKVQQIREGGPCRHGES